MKMGKRKSITLQFETTEMKEVMWDFFLQNRLPAALPKYLKDGVKNVHKQEIEPEMFMLDKTDSIKFTRFTKDKGMVLGLKDGTPVYMKYTSVGNDCPYVISEISQPQDKQVSLLAYFKRSGAADDPAGTFSNLGMVFVALSAIIDPAIKRKQIEEERLAKAAAEKAAAEEESPTMTPEKGGKDDTEESPK